MKYYLPILIIILFGCSKSETDPDPTNILKSKTWGSYKFEMGSREFNDFLIKDIFIYQTGNRIVFYPGDSLKTYFNYKLTFFDDNTMIFGTYRKRFLRCADCDEFVFLDSVQTIVRRQYFAKNTFVVLADSSGWNPEYYEAVYFDNNSVKFNKCVSVFGPNSVRIRYFNTMPLEQGREYPVDIFMKPIP